MRQGCFFRRFLELRNRQVQAPELPFAEVLTAVSIQSILQELNVTYRDGIYTPLVTLWVFLSQVLDRDSSCRQAVSRLFDEETNPIAVMKWKETLDFLEDATDRCEDVANVIEGVMVKHG